VIVVDTIDELRRRLASGRGDDRRIGFVPTMGYLHEGHLALIDEARARADVAVLSIFVNPLQFGPGEDLDRYPRNLARDGALAQGRGVDLLFAPSAEELYPGGPPQTRVTAPELTHRLCGAFRPGHFDGVLTVVAKLFNIVQPDVAVFGQKDLQQAVLIRRMVADLDFAIDIVVAPIVREPDGIAMSSRNSYLDATQRASARALSRALDAAQEAFAAGERAPPALVAAARAVLTTFDGVSEQYIELVDPRTLATPERARAGDALAIAAFVGATRLIDNRLLTEPSTAQAFDSTGGLDRSDR
jgi:pantoate--beta-alanine ligase